MQTLKSKQYTQADFKYFLRRRVKNMGLLQIFMPYPAGDYIDKYAITVTDNNIWISSFSGTNYLYRKYDKEMNILQSSLIGGSIQTPNIAALYDNQLFITEWSLHQVYYIGPDGILPNNALGDESGNPGSGDTQWYYPRAMAFSAKGQIHVCDEINSRVKIYDFGVYMSQGPLIAGQVSQSICSDGNGNTYVFVVYGGTDPGILKYSKTLGSYVASHGLSGDGYLSAICCNAVNKKIYYSNGANYTGIKQVDISTGWAVTNLSAAAASHYTLMASNSTYLAALNRDNSSIDIFDNSGALVTQIAGYSHYTITNLAMSDKYLYVMDTIYPVVTKYALSDFSVQGSFNTGLYNDVSGICVDPKDYLYLLQQSTNTVNKYNSSGVLCSTFAGPGSGDGQLNAAQAITFDAYLSQLYVADTGNTRLQGFSYGKYIGKYATNYNPTGITFDEAGYYAYISSGTIGKYDYDGNFIETILSTSIITDIAFSPTENAVYTNGFAGLGTGIDTRFLVKYNIDGSNKKYFTFRDFLSSQATGFFISGGFLYVAAMGTTPGVYVFEITPDYETTKIDVTKYIMQDSVQISYTSDDANFSLGKTTMGDIAFTVNNADDKWDFETNQDSLFYNSGKVYQRNQSLLSIELDGVEIARGLIDGKNITNAENLLKFNAQSPFVYLSTILSNSIISAITSGMTISEVLELVINNRYFENIIYYDAADIDIYNDVVIGDPTALPESVLDILSVLAELGGVKFGLYEGSHFYTENFIAKCKTGEIDYLITENNLFGVVNYNNGEQRLFATVTITYVLAGVDTVVQFVIPDSVRVCFNEDRDVAIDAKFITDPAVAAACAAVFQYVTTWPSKEIQVKIPLMITGGNVNSKTFGFNIFSNTRGIKFNTPSLDALTDMLPTKASAVDGNGRLIYYVMSLTHNIGKDCYSVLKLKEFIDDKP